VLKRQRGMTLIELIAAIVLMAVAIMALATVFKISTTGSSNAKRQAEALVLAHGAMEHVLTLPFNSPSLPACPNPSDGSTTNSIPWPLTDAQAQAISGYSATLTVDCTAAWAGIPATDAKRLTLTVYALAADDGTKLSSVTVDGYRTSYTSASSVTRTN
jgi:prepilin-type N-terminal cleavage/methylation domain-containing protein